MAEHINRLLSECITTMLDEPGLPKAFWGKPFSTVVHVWNRSSEPLMQCMVLNLMSYDMNPNWMCPTYDYGDAQKGRHLALDTHMEKCVFIGYPDGYKGWKFYNSTTKYTVISECADLDEHHLPISKRSTNMPGVPPHSINHPGAYIDAPALDDWLKDHRPNLSRIDNGIVCQCD